MSLVVKKSDNQVSIYMEEMMCKLIPSCIKKVICLVAHTHAVSFLVECFMMLCKSVSIFVSVGQLSVICGGEWLGQNRVFDASLMMIT